MRPKPKPLPVKLIYVARAITVGLAYYMVANIPGLTSSFVAIFVALLPFDLIIAMPRFSLRISHWKDLLLIILPNISGTAIALGAGLLLGIIFGGLVKMGLPLVIGAVFLIGLAYTGGLEIKGNVSSYVGIIAGLGLFDQIVRLERLSGDLLADIAGPSLRMFYGTFAALFAGWLVGVVVGILTRALLPRGYRSAKSSAYAQPLWMQSFKEVTHIGEDMILLQLVVNDQSDLANRTLSQVGLRTQYEVSVLSIFRGNKDIVAPEGRDEILAGDVIVVLAPAKRAQEIIALAKGSG